MKTLITIAVVIAVSLLPAVIAVAAPQITLGSFHCAGNYNAGAVTLADGKASLYWEHDGHLNADLFIAQWAINDRLTAVLRGDRPNWMRPGVKGKLGGGKTQTVTRLLAGNGTTPWRFDLWTPSLPLAKDLTLDGWWRSQEGCRPNIWVGPTLRVGGGSLNYLRDINGGPWSATVSLPPWQF